MKNGGAFLVAASLLILGCAGGAAVEDDAGGSGGETGSGGMASSGGTTGSGGSAQTGSGGATSTGGTGGSIGLGGTTGSGGDGRGGTVGAGGTTGAGGRGGTTGSGGTISTGGTTASGGTTGTGGTPGTGGAPPTGGHGGVTSSGGTTGSGGRAGGPGSGGATATGGTTGTAGSGGACSVVPVDPQATAEAKNLLCYLHSLYGNHVLSGQQETSWSNPANDITYYLQNVGKYPAILGGDYLYPSGTTSRAQAYWQAGGLTMMRYHMGAPPLADSYDNSMSSTNYANVLTAGTTENRSLLSKLDYLAGELTTLQNAKVAVIMALYHEVQPNGWFWWAKGTGAQFVQLWQMSFTYLTQTKGVHNVVWLLPFSGSPSASVFPGKAWVDISGPDEYAGPNSQPFTSNYTAARGIVGTTLPIPLHETGAAPQPANMFPTAAPWLLWNIWAGYENIPQGGVTYNTVASLKSAYGSSYTITRDLLPKL